MVRTSDRFNIFITIDSVIGLIHTGDKKNRYFHKNQRGN